MARIKLIIDPASCTSFEQPWIRPLIDSRYELIPYEPGVNYSPDSVVFATYQTELQPTPWFAGLRAQGHRVIIDHLWDGDVDHPSEFGEGTMTLRNANWLWYHSCLEWLHHGYDQYQPQRNPQYRFFMPINKQRHHRDVAVRRLAPVLDQALYSYVAQGRELANTNTVPAPWVSQFDPAWYNTTEFSVVCESYMRSRYSVVNPRNYRTEISEKTFKPIAFFHPFIVVGSVDTLKYLRREGFVTFDNLWSESYDTIVEDSDRLTAVLELIIDQANRPITVDAETQQRLQHNHDHFFDRDLVIRRFLAEIVGDCERFLNQ